jgi:hypothetical protein
MDREENIDIKLEYQNRVYDLEQELESFALRKPVRDMHKKIYKVNVVGKSDVDTVIKCLKETCKRTFLNINSLRLHIQTESGHQKFRNKNEEKKMEALECPNCKLEKLFEKPYQLIKHIKTHHRNKACSYADCSHEAKNKYQQSLHMCKVHGKKLACEKCKEVGIVWETESEEHRKEHLADVHYRPKYKQSLKEESKRKREEKATRPVMTFKNPKTESNRYWSQHKAKSRHEELRRIRRINEELRCETSGRN